MTIKVQSANNTIRVGVSISDKGSVQATSDRSSYYSDLARDWAIKMDGKVQDEDYSSKYYANESRQNADTAMDIVTDFDDHAQQLQDNFDTNATSKIIDFDNNAQNKIDEFNNNASNKQGLINAKVDEATIWAEGTDEQVQALGGEHSARGWAEQALPENITTQGNEFNLANQLVQLDSEGRLPSIDGSKLFNLQAYTEAETDLLLKDKQDKLIAGANITIDENNVISAIGGESDVFGVKGDYSARYGIIDCPNGLANYAVGTKDITFNAGIVLVAPNNETKITMASEYTYSILGTEDVTLFYVAGDIVEVHSHDVFWQTNEPENGETGYLAWWNGQQWQFKSNDTGNVWRSAIAQPLVNVRIINDIIVRLDYIGYRTLDNKVFTDINFSNITDEAKMLIAHNASPSATTISLNIGASGTIYTAPADGRFCVVGSIVNGGYVGQLWLANITTTLDMASKMVIPAVAGMAGSIVIEASKGDTVQLVYSNINVVGLYFNYLNGSESEAQ